MVEKVRVAAEARSDPDFLIIARTDARTSLGLDEALARGQAFADAGADVIFIEAPEDEAEIARIGETFDKPLLANMVDSGKTPIVPAERLAALGYSIAIYPAIGMLPAAGAMKRAFETLLRDGSTANVDAPMISLPEMHTLMGFEDVWAFERRWARRRGGSGGIGGGAPVRIPERVTPGLPGPRKSRRARRAPPASS